MEEEPTNELQVLELKLKAARSAAVPNLVEIRQCKKRFMNCLARLVVQYMREHAEKRDERTALTVITNDAPASVEQRGICSPMKTPEIRQFEHSTRALFGDFESCETTWGDRYLGSE